MANANFAGLLQTAMGAANDSKTKNKIKDNSVQTQTIDVTKIESKAKGSSLVDLTGDGEKTIAETGLTQSELDKANSSGNLTAALLTSMGSSRYGNDKAQKNQMANMIKAAAVGKASEEKAKKIAKDTVEMKKKNEQSFVKTLDSQQLKRSSGRSRTLLTDTLGTATAPIGKTLLGQ